LDFQWFGSFIGCLLQSKLFPQYFWLQTGSAVVTLATLHYSGTGILRPQLITLGEIRSSFQEKLKTKMLITWKTV